ncbi:MAG: methyltransferase [bacterium]|nr:methyltransferase [bacterium]
MNKIDFHKREVVECFSQKALGYERHARLQKLVATRLASFFPKLDNPDILEIGCGTGFLTAHLVAHYPGAHCEITDLSQTMLDECAQNFHDHKHLHFRLMDGEHPDVVQRYDLIATSMTVQWFIQPAKSLTALSCLLKPGGVLLYSTVGPDLFVQWRTVLRELGLSCGIVDIGELPGVIGEDTYPMCFQSGVQFLQNLKVTGASTPRSGYSALTSGELRSAIRLFETKMQARADWHILYGQLRA